ncbi:MAG: AbrB/MazE/SpoVT family DNA-binding domain-containing protein [Burkholderiaceae bacterium]
MGKSYRSSSGLRVPASSVTSKDRVTIPKALRQQLGIRQGSRIEFRMVGDRVEMRVCVSRVDKAGSGFGMLESKRPSVPADFDPAQVHPFELTRQSLISGP